MLHKALYSGHNDHNYFEIAHTMKYVDDMVGNNFRLYSFVDNHDVERIYTKLNNKAHFVPVHIMLYTVPGIPAIYYGSEFGIEGRKEQFSDDSLRPALNYEDYKNSVNTNPYTKLIATLGKIRKNTPALVYGDFKELILQNTYYAYSRTIDGQSVVIAVNNADEDISMRLPVSNETEYTGALSGEIWIPTKLNHEDIGSIDSVETRKMPESKEADETPKSTESVEPVETPEVVEPVEMPETEEAVETAEAERIVNENTAYEDMSVEELQEVILEKMKRNGPVTEYMRGTVRENTHHGSLVTWAKSFG